jgi:hypothetical protein
MHVLIIDPQLLSVNYCLGVLNTFTMYCWLVLTLSPSVAYTTDICKQQHVV